MHASYHRAINFQFWLLFGVWCFFFSRAALYADATMQEPRMRRRAGENGGGDGPAKGQKSTVYSGLGASENEKLHTSERIKMGNTCIYCNIFEQEPHTWHEDIYAR